MLSSEEYVVLGGGECPNCGSTEIHSGHLEPDGPIAWAQVRCETCDSIWVDLWKLTGYSDLETDPK